VISNSASYIGRLVYVFRDFLSLSSLTCNDDLKQTTASSFDILTNTSWPYVTNGFEIHFNNTVIGPVSVVVFQSDSFQAVYQPELLRVRNTFLHIF